MLSHTIKEFSGIKEPKILFLILGFYFYIIIGYLIGYFIFGFPTKGVYGPGNEFVPFFRIFFMIFILLIPFIGVFTYIGYSYNNKKRNFIGSWVDQMLEVIPQLLLWIILWPGVYFIVGFHFHILDLIFDASAPISHYWNNYWLFFLIVGRMFDVIQFKFLADSQKIERIEMNVFFQFIIFLFIDLGLICFIPFIQMLVFMFSFVPAIPLMMLSNTQLSGLALGFVVAFFWPVFSSTAYIFCFIFRGILRSIFLRKNNEIRSLNENYLMKEYKLF